MLERGGDVVTAVVPNLKRWTLWDEILGTVPPSSYVHTDELHSYRGLATCGYRHSAVNHPESEYVVGSVTVNDLEGFWAQVKRTIGGTHIHVSQRKRAARSLLQPSEYDFDFFDHRLRSRR